MAHIPQVVKGPMGPMQPPWWGLRTFGAGAGAEHFLVGIPGGGPVVVLWWSLLAEVLPCRGGGMKLQEQLGAEALLVSNQAANSWLTG